MSFPTWVIVSWVFVAILTGINIFVFLKLKKATEVMMKMAFPCAKNLNDAMGQMQSMLGAARMAGGKGKGRNNPYGGRSANNPQLRAAMDMLNQMQRGRKR